MKKGAQFSGQRRLIFILMLDFVDFNKISCRVAKNLTYSD
jgi:hypothetical protein